MYILQHYFDAVTTGQKSSQNGSVLSKFFTPPQTTTARIDTKNIADEMGQALAQIFKDYGKQHNIKFRFTKKVKVGAPR